MVRLDARSALGEVADGAGDRLFAEQLDGVDASFIYTRGDAKTIRAHVSALTAAYFTLAWTNSPKTELRARSLIDS